MKQVKYKYNAEKNSVEWKTIPNFSSYEVSNKGEVRSKFKTLNPNINHKGYYYITLRDDNGDVKFKPIHSLLLEAFIGKPREIDIQVNHKNGIKSDNSIENLEWVTCKENMVHSFCVLGRKSGNPFLKGDKHKKSKLREHDLTELYNHLKNNGSLNSFAKSKGVDVFTIWKVVNLKTWKHVKINWQEVYSINTSKFSPNGKIHL